jgi:hypothetical protein
MESSISQLNKAYFWDVDFNKLDKTKSMRLIIERIMNLGNLSDINLIRKIYTEDEIRQTICNLKYLDPKTLNFASLLFNIPKTRFKCYSKKQSVNIPWSY